jgi:hypothetical protein
MYSHWLFKDYFIVAPTDNFHRDHSQCFCKIPTPQDKEYTTERPINDNDRTQKEIFT